MLACANLLPRDDDEMRREVIVRAFQQCCKDGQVGEMVLNHLRRAAPPDLFKELLADSIPLSGRARLKVDDLPHEWRCNIRERDNYVRKQRQGKGDGRNCETRFT